MTKTKINLLSRMSIINMDDVKGFVAGMCDLLGASFNAGDYMDQYIDDDGEYVFTEKQAGRLEDILQKCGAVCSSNDTDIDTVVYDEYVKRGYIVID